MFNTQKKITFQFQEHSEFKMEKSQLLWKVSNGQMSERLSSKLSNETVSLSTH